jgi:hypothetical protein
MTNARALALVCLFALFGFGHEFVMAGVLPLVVLDRGGDAAVIGILVAAYGIPTIALRPFLAPDSTGRDDRSSSGQRRRDRDRRWASVARDDARSPPSQGAGWARTASGRDPRADRACRRSGPPATTTRYLPRDPHQAGTRAVCTRT